MHRPDTLPPPMAPAAHARAQAALRRGWWRRWLAWAVPVLCAALGWLWHDKPPAARHAVAAAPVEQARQATQPWPFGAVVPGDSVAAAAGASPWDRLRPVEEGEDTSDDLGPDPRQRNAGIDPARLSVQRPLAASAFLDHVVLQPEPRGGFIVEAVLPGSRYERAGLRPGDTIYSIDLPEQPPIDENNMVALTGVSEIAFNVVRAGALVRLSARLNEEAPAHGPS
ncbi:MAG: hypothetical protein Q8N13_24340 [Acidovorax sp.]|nr:hypothetical protein [Acidovorax sp.]